MNLCGIHILGKKTSEELEMNYYTCLIEKDGKLFSGGKSTPIGYTHPLIEHPKDNGVSVHSPDWDPNPNVRIGHGLYIVGWHPLGVHDFGCLQNPGCQNVRYFEVAPIGKLVTMVDTLLYRVREYTRLREIIPIKSPELNQAILLHIATSPIMCSRPDVRNAAIRLMTDRKALMGIAENEKAEYVRRVAEARLVELS